MKDRALQKRHGAEIYLLLGLAVVCLGIVVLCTVNSLQWIGKPFPGFLIMGNRVVPSAGLYHWSGLKAANIFMCEVFSANGEPLTSAGQLWQLVGSLEPGTAVDYVFRRGDELLPLTIEVMRFTARDYVLLFASYLANGLAFMIIGFAVRLARPSHPASLPMLLAMLFSGLWAVTACDLYGPYWLFNIHVIFESFMPAAIIHLVLVFPEPLKLIRRRPRLVLLPYVISAVLSVPYEIHLFEPDIYVLTHNGATIFLGLGLLLSLVLIAATYVRTDSMLTKQRVRILLLGYFSGLLLPTLIVIGAVLFKGAVSFTQIAFFTILWPLSTGYAILKHNFFDIDEVVKRSIYYISLTSTVLVAYLVFMLILNRLFDAYGFTQSRYFPLVFCAVILVIFNPLRERVQRFIDRVFFRVGYDFRETVEAVSARMTSLLNLDEIADTLLDTVTETMQVGRGVITLRGSGSDISKTYQKGQEPAGDTPGADDDRNVELLASLQESPTVLSRYDAEDEAGQDDERAGLTSLMAGLGLVMVVPILFKSQMIGTFGVGAKKSGRPYSRVDLDLLITLANQSSVAFANARSYRELEKMNLNLEGLVQERTLELEQSKRELEASYEKLKELDKLKSQFFSNVGHELRTPLTLSLSPLESVLQDPAAALSGEQRIMLGTIHKNALKLLKLVNNLLDFSKIESGRLRLNIGRHRLLPFLEEIVEPFQLAGQKKGVDVVLDAVGDGTVGPELYYDSDRMEKVFANLLSNAFKFTPAPGRIRMTVTENEEGVSVSVSDSGAGIPAVDVPRIFERFYQAGSRETRRTTGTGIGLSLVKEFVELHGGTVSVESVEGQGTTFVVRLLKGKEHLPADEIEERSDEEDGIVTDSGRRLNLLDVEMTDTAPAADSEDAAVTAPDDAPCLVVAEDNPEMRRFIRMILQKNYRIREAEDGMRALELCRESPPDLILSDVSMPRMTGFEFCRAVKDDPELRLVPFILITSRAEVQYRIEGFESGADEYVGKPFNVRELEARIRSLITLREMQRKLKKTFDDLREAHEELKATESQLVQSEKMASLGQLVAGIAHELNNPISFVYANVKVLQEYVEAIQKCMAAYREAGRESARAEELEEVWRENDMEYIMEDVHSLLDGCYEGASRTKQIVQDLRTYSRVEGSSRQVVDLNESMRGTVNILSNGMEEGVSVHLELAELPPVDCHSSQINQVFMNLVTNAVQAVGQSGDVWVRSRLVEPDLVEFEVSDNGCGIPADVIGKVFDPFFTTKPVGQGTGLGLSISYSIVEKHGGTLTVSSEPGEGAQFTIRLPLKMARSED